jgi:SutA-like transcriptional regulator
MEQGTNLNEMDGYSPEARAEEREQLAADVEKFLQTGGQVAEIPKGERADPPRKPENNYGRGSI